MAAKKEEKVYQPGDVLGNLIATQAGLPNSCAATGEKIPAKGIWFALHEDAARSGQGFCQAHAEQLAAQAAK